MLTDHEQQRRAKAYARARRRLTFLTWGLSAGYLALWMVTGATPAVRDMLAARVASPWFVVAGVGTALAVPFELLTFPLAVYGGFLLSHRFGQSRQTFAQWMWDVLKGWAVGGTLGLAMLEGLYAILRWQPASN